MTELQSGGLRGLLHADEQTEPPPSLGPRSEQRDTLVRDSQLPDGTLTSVEPEPLSRDPFPVQAGLPTGAALLCVQRAPDGEFAMTWYDHGPTPARKNIRPPKGDQSIAAIMERAQTETDKAKPQDGENTPSAFSPWERAYNLAADRWEGMDDPLEDWITRLRAEAKETAQLVIWDNTGTDQPWELYYGVMGTDANNYIMEGWLGVTLPVSRWVGGDPHPYGFKAQQNDATGGVLLFDDWTSHTPGKPDNYGIVGQCLAGDQEETHTGLLKRLADHRESFGLLMIRGHGEYNADTETYTMAGLSLLQLATAALTALQANRPVVLLHSCSSGRTFVEETAINQPVRSFVERFVKAKASAVIAVLADLDLTHLHGAALELVGEAAKSPVTVSDWLRRRRATYFAEIEPGREDVYRMFLTSCLYVSYGHPGTTLRITVPQPEPSPTPIPQGGDR